MRCSVVRLARLVRAGLQMYQARRLAVAPDADGRSEPGGAPVVGDGGRHVVDDHDRERSGGRAERRTARSARPAAHPGVGGRAPPAPAAPLPAGPALAVGPAHPGPDPAVAPPACARTLAGYSRTVGTRATVAENPSVCLHVKL